MVRSPSDFPRSRKPILVIWQSKHTASAPAHMYSLNVPRCQGFITSQPHGDTHKSISHKSKFNRSRRPKFNDSLLLSTPLLGADSPSHCVCPRVFFSLPSKNNAGLFSIPELKLQLQKSKSQVHFFLRASGAAIMIGRLSKTTSLSS